MSARFTPCGRCTASGALDGRHEEATAAAVGGPASTRRPACAATRVQVLPRDAKSVQAHPRRRSARRTTTLKFGWRRCWRWPIMPPRRRTPARPCRGRASIRRTPATAGFPMRPRRRGQERPAVSCKALSATKEPPAQTLAVVARSSRSTMPAAAPSDSVGGVTCRRLADGRPKIADAVVRGLARGWPKDEPPKLDEQAEQKPGQCSIGCPPAARRSSSSWRPRWGSKKLAKYGGEARQSLLAAGRETTSARDASASPRRRATDRPGADEDDGGAAAGADHAADAVRAWPAVSCDALQATRGDRCRPDAFSSVCRRLTPPAAPPACASC